MGVSNRARRAAKARQRAKQRARRTGSGPGETYDAFAARRDADHTSARDRSTDLWNECEGELHRTLVAIWGGGWQPTELVREIRRSTKGPGPSELLRHVIAVDNARREPDTLHPRWRSQIAALDLPDTPPATRWLAVFMRDRAVADASTPTILLSTLAGLTRLPRLLPPPGGAPSDVDIDLAGGTASLDADDAVLTRVRALLAQAESTTYPAEAEVFTAKAHALMTRHAIDAALLDRSAGDGWTTALRIPIDDPYVDSKSLLLHVVAGHSRCRTVFHPRYAMCTVVGANADIAATELLFTSLLLQAQQALLAEGDEVGAGALQRSRSFRSAFLFAYANRIGERLAEVNASVIAEAEAEARAEGASAGSVLPVLARRSQVVDEAFDRLFGDLVEQRVRAGWNSAGWSSGRRAADRARLGEPDLPAGRDTSAMPPAPDQLGVGS